MNQGSEINTIVGILSKQGLTSEEISQRLNDAGVASQQQINLDNLDTNSTESLNYFLSEYKGMQSMQSELKPLENHAEWHQAVNTIRQEKEFLFSGWKVFQNIRWMSLIYMAMLTFLVIVLDFFVGPGFESVFASFDAELPYVTNLYFASGNLAMILLAVIWIVALTYMMAINKCKRDIKTYRLIPNWLYVIPMLTRVVRVLNRAVLLSKLHFLAHFDALDLNALTADKQKLGLIDSAKDKEQFDALLSHLMLAKELGISRDFLARQVDEIFERYVDVATRSMRLLSIIGTLLLGFIIASIVIAMYSPIFIFGSII